MKWISVKDRKDLPKDKVSFGNMEREYMSEQLVSQGHQKDCVARILNSCWQCNGRFDMGICDKGDKCDRYNLNPGCSPECNLKKRFDEIYEAISMAQIEGFKGMSDE